MAGYPEIGEIAFRLLFFLLGLLSGWLLTEHRWRARRRLQALGSAVAPLLGELAKATANHRNARGSAITVRQAVPLVRALLDNPALSWPPGARRGVGRDLEQYAQCESRAPEEALAAAEKLRATLAKLVR